MIVVIASKAKQSSEQAADFAMDRRGGQGRLAMTPRAEVTRSRL
jgi:hypothetical protein